MLWQKFWLQWYCFAALKLKENGGGEQMKSHMLIISYEFSLYYTSIKYGLSDSRADQSAKKKKVEKNTAILKELLTV